MIQSTRQGCARALSSSNVLSISSLVSCIPHAESSMHAIRRSVMLQRQQRLLTTDPISRRRKGKITDGLASHAVHAGYSTAAAMTKDSGEGAEETMARRSREARTGRSIEEQGGGDPSIARNWPVDSSQPFHARLSLPEVTDPDPHLGSAQVAVPTIEENPLIALASKPFENAYAFRSTFQEIARTRPLLAFLSLRDISDQSFSLLTAEHIDLLLRRFLNLPMHEQRDLARLNPEIALAILERIKAHLERLAPRSREVTKHRPEYQPGTRFRGRRLRQFLEVCVLFGAENLAREVFVAHFPEQIRQGLCQITELEAYLLSLSLRKRSNLIIETFTHPCFPAHEPHLPLACWTPKLFCIVGQAFMTMRRGEALLELGKRFRSLAAQNKQPIPPAVYTILLQAAVATGNHQEAKIMRAEARKRGDDSEETDFTIQMAIIRGQSTLGFDQQLEERILKDLPARPDHASQLLHRLIELRLKNQDTAGAKRLLDRFDLSAPIRPKSTSAPGGLTPTARTVSLAFGIVSYKADLEHCETWWRYLLTKPGMLDDRAVASVVRAMSSAGLTEEAYQMVRARLFKFRPLSPLWCLPLQAEVGIVTLNTLSDCMSKSIGLKGLQRTTDLMRQAHISADANTLKVILDAVRREMTVRPEDLAGLLQVMLERANNVRAQIGHVDSIMAEAVRLASASPTFPPTLSTNATLPFQDPTGGLVPTGKFAETIEQVLESLRERAIGSDSMSAATRLRFEALIGNPGDEVPAAEKVWNEFIEMGYKPDKRHILALMQGYADAGEMNQAERAKTLAGQMGIEPTVGMYMVLLIGWGKMGGVGVDKARRAYDAIKSELAASKNVGLDTVAVAAMVQVYYRNRMWHTAAELVREDLAPRSGLSDKAILVGMTALRWAGDEVGAIDLLERRIVPCLNFFLRVAVRRIRVHLDRKLREGRATDRESATMARVQEILDKDVHARPYIAQGSLFTKPPHDRVPRFYNAKSLKPRLYPTDPLDRTGQIADMVSARPPVRISTKTLQSLYTMLDPTTTSAPSAETIQEVQRILDEHRQALENEIRSVRPVGAAIQSDTLTDVESAMVDKEMERYEETLMRHLEKMVESKTARNGSKQAGRKKRSIRPKLHSARVKPPNPDGRVDVAVRTHHAAEKRLARRTAAIVRAQPSRLGPKADRGVEAVSGGIIRDDGILPVLPTRDAVSQAAGLPLGAEALPGRTYRRRAGGVTRERNGKTRAAEKMEREERIRRVALRVREESGVESQKRKKSRKGKGVGKKQEQEVKEESEGKEKTKS
ncbi:hypothetical protein DB88DRAFT_538803 [Papiliotrema laurentii]|uniref:Uncharacterized protein n=1 Tax=Papiliotrema laurentii TaxID=5418 RepID=A0AAD9FSC7_PAPLA|nr:hypothetical protein DB88DRAFT_538803 [Papiliotrema laurentii]